MCQVPPFVDNASVQVVYESQIQTGEIVLSKIAYVCDEGYIINDELLSQTRCSYGGVWDYSELPVCFKSKIFVYIVKF